MDETVKKNSKMNILKVI